MLRVDQSRRWERGERPGAEDYLRQYPRVADDEGTALDLIHNEFLLRERRGERPGLGEYLGRFPQYASGIRTQIELHLALETQTHTDHDGGRPRSTTGGTGLLATAGDLDDEPALPEVFGRYRVQERLGRGGMGTVYLAYDTQLERRVALKVLRFGYDPGGHLIRRFLREARIAASFTDPHLCPIYDAGEQDGLPYLTMPLLEGETLAARLGRRGSLPRREAVRLAARVARALAVAHRAGVIHRDVKPANVMIDGRGEPIVLDFGLARRDAPRDAVSTESGALLGTPAYMAPEQIGGDPEAVGSSCDIYGLGVMLYQMLTGRVPFNGSTHEIFRQTLTGVPAPPSRHRPDLGRRLDQICLTALAKRPGDRFATMDAFAGALEAELQDDGPPPSSVAHRPRRRAAWLASLAVLAILSGTVAWMVMVAVHRPAARHREARPAPGRCRVVRHVPLPAPDHGLSRRHRGHSPREASGLVPGQLQDGARSIRMGDRGHHRCPGGAMGVHRGDQGQPRSHRRRPGLGRRPDRWQFHERRLHEPRARRRRSDTHPLERAGGGKAASNETTSRRRPPADLIPRPFPSSPSKARPHVGLRIEITAFSLGPRGIRTPAPTGRRRVHYWAAGEHEGRAAFIRATMEFTLTSTRRRS